MQIDDVIWLEQIVEKIESKHHISLEEVEEVLSNRQSIVKPKKEEFMVKICTTLTVRLIADATCLA